MTLPLRPVAIAFGKTVNNGWGGYECCWARTLHSLPGRRARRAGRHARHHGAAQSPGRQSLVERHAGPGRLHALSDESDRQGRLDFASDRAQRASHAGAAGRQFGLEPGARTDASRLDDAEGGFRPAPARAAARRLARLPHQSGDFVLGHQGGRRDDGEVPVHRLLRLDARRDQSRRRRAAARLHRSRGSAAPAHRRHQIYRAVLGSSGLRVARSGGAAAGRGEGLHLDRDRAGAPHRPARGVQCGDQSRRRRRQAHGRELRFLARRDQGARRRRDLGRQLPGGERRAHRRRRDAGARLVPRQRLPRQAVLAAEVVPLSEAGRAGPALRAALPGAAAARRQGARAAPARARHHLVGQAARRIRGAAALARPERRCGRTRSPSTSRCRSPTIRSG